MSQDTLSDVLRTVRLRSAVFYYVSCDGTWVAEAPASREIAAAVMPDAEHVIEYHVLTAGECWVSIVGGPPVKMQRGDIVLIAQGDAHVVSSEPGLRADPDIDSYFELGRDTTAVSHTPRRQSAANRPRGQVAAARHAGLFRQSRLRLHRLRLAAFQSADRDAAASAAFAGRRAAARGASNSQRSPPQESAAKRPGSEAVLERLAEMMFVDAIRRHVDQLPEHTTGWLAGLRDRFVGRALALMHERPSAPWTIDDLSGQVGLSRSALHERFVSLVGQPPVQYLTNWRMQLASRKLLEGRSSVAAVALDVGYDSEAAFARAFKRLVGMPPAAWRRAQESLPTAEAH